MGVLIIIVLVVVLLLLAAFFFFFRDGRRPLATTSTFNVDECLKNTDPTDKCWFSPVVDAMNCVAQCKENAGLSPFPLKEAERSRLLEGCKEGCRSSNYGYAEGDCLSACDYQDCMIAVDAQARLNNYPIEKIISETEKCVQSSIQKGSGRDSGGSYFACLANEVEGTNPRVGLKYCGEDEIAGTVVDLERNKKECRKLAAQLKRDCPEGTACCKE